MSAPPTGEPPPDASPQPARRARVGAHDAADADGSSSMTRKAGAPAPLSLRPMAAADLPAALAIQTAVYPPALCEDADAFASRLALPDSLCLAAERDGALAGYLLAHG